MIAAALAGVAVSQEPQQNSSQSEERAPAKPKRIRIGEQALQRRLVHRVKPKYPEEARRAHLKGAVRLRVLIGEDGHVKEAWPVEGDPVLGRAATDAVRLWEYQPVRLNGEPVQVESEISVKF
jgi:TonB family protein